MILNREVDFIVDAIDNLTAKAHLLNTCRERKLAVVTSAGAAARLDPAKIKMTDLADSYGDPMAQQLRKILRQKYDWPSKGEFGIACVFSDEEPIQPVELHYDHGEGFKCVCPQNQNNLHSCEHRNVIWGTASFVTGAFGLHIASYIVREVLKWQ
jgi:tRNA A37 threonylcarbamoyladenosine dehydratase